MNQLRPCLSELQGLILTRQQQDQHGQLQLRFWIASARGPLEVTIDGQQPVFILLHSELAQAQTVWQHQQLQPASVRPLPLKTFQQAAVVAIYSFSLAQQRQLLEALRGTSIAPIETDIRSVEHFLMERFIYGAVKVEGKIEWQGRYWRCRNPKLSPAAEVPVLTSVSLDLECSPQGELYSIGLSYGNHPQQRNTCAQVLMIGSPRPDTELNISWVNDERALLLALQQWFEQHDPDAIIGWAVGNFDLRLLSQRAEHHRVPLRLGRDGTALRWLKARDNTESGTALCSGRVILDGIEQLKNASWQFESFSLEYVSQRLFGEGKLLANEADKGLAIMQLFEQDPVALARYNLQDCLLVERVFAQAQLIEYAIQRALLTGLALDRRGGSVAAFTNLYLPLLHRSGYVAPNIGDIEAQHSPGGYVMDSRPGLYRWVLVLDFKSLYPSIIRTFAIDPLGLIEGLRQPSAQTIPGYREARFSRTQHHLPGILDKLAAAREQAKRDGNQPFQHAIKIIMNSMYGVLGSAGCRFHDTRLASSITLRGHDIMRDTRALIEQQGDTVIYGDTDSTFVWLKGCESAEQAQARGRELEKTINNYWQTRIAAEWQLESQLEIEFETCFSRFFMPTIRGSETGSKKRYAGLKVTAQGSELLFKGLETVRSDWTEMAQQFQQQLYARVFADQRVDDLVRDTVAALSAGQLDQQLIYHKRLRRPLHEYEKNVPPQVRAARLADAQNRKLGRPLQYQRRGRIAYLITVNGPEPAEYLQSPIDYQHYIDKQLRPIAEAILPLVGRDFDSLCSDQLGLF